MQPYLQMCRFLVYQSSADEYMAVRLFFGNIVKINFCSEAEYIL